jgi:glycolate oxidase iron-sulfur subunit
MRAVADGRIPLSDSVTRHLDLCLDCRSCESACPSGVQYGRLIEPFRLEMREKASGTIGSVPDTADWFQRWILYGLFPYPRRLRLALAPMRILQWLGLDRRLEQSALFRLLPEKLQRMQRLLPRLPAREPKLPDVLPAIGPRRARVALFTGCVANALFHHVNWATARVLQANGCDVVVPQSQQCCGAIHYHSGAGRPALEFAKRNARAFDLQSVDAVIVNVAGCGSMLKDYGHMAREVAPGEDSIRNTLERLASKVRDVSEFLADLGAIAPTGVVSWTATYHDACHLAHAQRVREQPRELLSLVPGLKLVPLPESEICCGAAGSYNLTEGALADRLGERKAQHILSTGAEAIITGNAGCTLQIQSALKKLGQPLPVVHPMEVLDWSYRGGKNAKFQIPISK